jgi:hypothetical protein
VNPEAAWVFSASEKSPAHFSTLRLKGGEIEQIQFLLGHASVLTTERYLGRKQNLEEPVNDRFGCLFASTETGESFNEHKATVALGLDVCIGSSEMCREQICRQTSDCTCAEA